MSEIHRPQTIFTDGTLDHALRQLVLYRRAGLAVLSPDGRHPRGWVTRHSVLGVLAERVKSSQREAEQGRLAAEFSDKDAASRVHIPGSPLEGYEIVELTVRAGSLTVRAGSRGAGKRLREVNWPPGSQVVGVSERHELVTPRSDLHLRPGERVALLAPIKRDDPQIVSGAPSSPKSGS